jgi:hypothetical protein
MAKRYSPLMVLFAASFLLAAAAAPAAEPVLGRVWPGSAAERVRACGFDHVALWYDRSLDEYAIIVSGSDHASDQQLSCAAKTSLDTDYSIAMPAALTSRYDALYWPMAEDAARRHAREWLARRGLLKKLPTYEKGRTDELALARRLEHLCGPRAKGAFHMDDGLVTLMVTPDRSELDARTLDCLSNALWASGLPTGLLGRDP